MQCTKPVRLQPKGHPELLTLGCGKCLACRIQKRKEWSMRLWHELAYHDKSVFLTLTYDDDYMPYCDSLRLRDLQLFFKRLRKDLAKRDETKIKYFACGEYGSLTDRPHYHAIIYGLGLDREDKRMVIDNWPLCDWTVDSIRKNSFGAVTPQSINYVAGYIHSKLSGLEAERQYAQTGREPVFRVISQGIGKQFALDNQEQIKQNQNVTQFGVKHSIPRYYINKLGIDTEPLKQNAIISECESIEHYTGFYTTREGLIKSGDIEAEKKYRNGIRKSRKAKEDTLKAKIALKGSKL